MVDPMCKTQRWMKHVNKRKVTEHSYTENNTYNTSLQTRHYKKQERRHEQIRKRNNILENA